MQTAGRPLSRLAKAGYAAFTVMVVAVVAPSAAAQAAVQSRNAGASICSGLPAANPSPGVPQAARAPARAWRGQRAGGRAEPRRAASWHLRISV
jgi:hypothetical protein